MMVTMAMVKMMTVVMLMTSMMVVMPMMLMTSMMVVMPMRTITWEPISNLLVPQSLPDSAPGILAMEHWLPAKR